MGKSKKAVAVMSKTTPGTVTQVEPDQAVQQGQDGFELIADHEKKKTKQKQDAGAFLKQSGVAAAGQMRPRVKWLRFLGVVFGGASDLLEALQEIDPIHFAGTVIALIK
jgi:hypothetical protein